MYAAVFSSFSPIGGIGFRVSVVDIRVLVFGFCFSGLVFGFGFRVCFFGFGFRIRFSVWFSGSISLGLVFGFGFRVRFPDSVFVFGFHIRCSYFGCRIQFFGFGCRGSCCSPSERPTLSSRPFQPRDRLLSPPHPPGITMLCFFVSSMVIF